MNIDQNQTPKKGYIAPSLKIAHIVIEESFAASSIQPLNNHTEVKEQWEELGDVIQDVEW